MERKYWALIAIIGFAVVFYGSMILYLKFGWFKRLYHDIMGWHMPEKDGKCTFDGCSVHTRCRFCGKDIMQDSQGNWF